MPIFVEPEATVIEMTRPDHHVERCGRVSYKSNSPLDATSSRNFLRNLVSRGHFSVLEHANFIVEVTHESVYKYSPAQINTMLELLSASNKFVNVTINYINKDDPFPRILISFNLRSLAEGTLPVSLGRVVVREYPYLDEVVPTSHKHTAYDSDFFEEEYLSFTSRDALKLGKLTAGELAHHLYTTILMTTDRGVANELVRHRVGSYTQESTRYCNYSKDKFGNQIRVIRPAEYTLWSDNAKSKYDVVIGVLESLYNEFTTCEGISPQFARSVLPMSLATDIVVTGNHNYWAHFFDLRLWGLTGSPHPDMQFLAQGVYRAYNNYNDKDFDTQADLTRRFEASHPRTSESIA